MKRIELPSAIMCEHKFSSGNIKELKVIDIANNLQQKVQVCIERPVAVMQSTFRFLMPYFLLSYTPAAKKKSEKSAD